MGTHTEKLQQEARNVVGKNWSGGKLTRTKLLGNLNYIALFAANMGYQHVNQINGRFVARFFEHLRGNEMAPTTIAGYATSMRILAKAIGKSNIVPRGNDTLGGARAGTRLVPKTPNLEKMLDVRETLYAKAQWLGVAHDLRAAFGLRAKESLLSKITFTDGRGRTLLMIEGTKGNRPRSLVIDTVEKIAAVATLKEHLMATGGKSLIPQALSLLQAYNMQKNAIHRAGGTKANGANAHLARHAYAQALAKMDIDRKAIAEDLGHGRIEVISHYVRK